MSNAHRIWAAEDHRHPAAELPTAQDAAEFAAVLRREFPGRPYRTDQEAAAGHPFRSGDDLAPIDGPDAPPPPAGLLDPPPPADAPPADPQ